MKNKTKILFKEESLPYNVMAIDNNYIIASRKLDLREDKELLKHRVDMNAYISIKEAYNNNRDNPVYSIIDLKNNVRSSDNLVFKMIDYFDKKECKKVLEKLNNNEIGLSERDKIELNMRWV